MHGSDFSLLYAAQYITSNDHQCMVCSVFNKLFHSCGSLAVSIGQKEKALLHFFSRARSLGPSVPMAPTILGTFIQRSSLVAAGIQLVVALTTLLMVVRFGLDALRHRTGSNGVKVTLQILDTVTYSMVHYCLGIMQRPSATNSYYQVWAVLLVTLRYSVKIGRPAGIAVKQTPLVDLMSSFWAAHILRSNVTMVLKFPGWLLWSVNSARIIHGFVSSENANDSHKESIRLLTDYMRHEHKVVSGSGRLQRPEPSSMKAYRYLVLGEAKKLKGKHEDEQQATDGAGATEAIKRLLLALTEDDKELITLERIWNHQERRSSRVSACLCGLPPGCCDILDEENKDLCLSFALYKLLRRRFFNLPIHEARLQKTSRLVLDGILRGSRTCTNDQQQGDAVRAFRVSEAEVAFLNDFFNSRYAIIFARGFPWLRLALSTLLLGGISGMAVAVHKFSKIAREDELGSVRHGVYFTWVILALLSAKEIWEITTYAFSDWTKVLLLCKYVEQPWWLRGYVGIVARPLVRMFLCRKPLFKRWHGKVGQFNLLFSRTYIGQRRYSFSIHLSQQVKNAVIDSFKNSLSESLPLGNYLEQAVNKNSLGIKLVSPSDNQEQAAENAQADGGGHRVIVERLQDDVHTLLVWHIATCYCELELAKARNVRVSIWLCGRGFARQRPSDVDKPWWHHYLVARTLSQYCCYLLKLVPPLVPGNSLMAKAVLDEVFEERKHLLHWEHQNFPHCGSSVQILDRLRGYESGNIVLDANEQGNTILKKGAVLGRKLTETTGDNSEALWKFLAEFWSGYIVYLAASTRASQHKMYLSTGGELVTHLWALLSHAGYLGAIAHGEQFLETVLIRDQPYNQSVQF